LIILCLLLFSFSQIRVGKTDGTIHIKADGSVEGTDKIQRVGDMFTFTDNINDSIVVERDNVVVDGRGYTLQGNGEGRGIDLRERDNVTIKTLEIRAFTHGIYLDKSEENTLIGNNIVDNVHGIMLWWGSKKNIISGNNITNNGNGLYFAEATGNIIIGNSIVNNTCGIYSWILCFNNRIYNNNFIHNTKQTDDLEPVHVPEDRSQHIWENGYPSGGNYWSHFYPVDLKTGPGQNITGSDGIVDYGETVLNTGFDYYPLTAPIKTFNAGTWDLTEYYVDVTSNSTVSSFHFNSSKGPFIHYNVSGQDNTTGFSRATIPKELLWTENSWNITIDGQSLTPRIVEDNESTYLYFTYDHNTKTVEIRGTTSAPESPNITLITIFSPDSILMEESNKTFTVDLLLRNDGKAEAVNVKAGCQSDNGNLSLLSSGEISIPPGEEGNLSTILMAQNNEEEYVSSFKFNVVFETASGKKRTFETPSVSLTATPYEALEPTPSPAEIVAIIIIVVAIGILASAFILRRRTAEQSSFHKS
jgi:parallel beta-helix repeat protein